MVVEQRRIPRPAPDAHAQGQRRQVAATAQPPPRARARGGGGGGAPCRVRSAAGLGLSHLGHMPHAAAVRPGVEIAIAIPVPHYHLWGREGDVPRSGGWLGALGASPRRRRGTGTVLLRGRAGRRRARGGGRRGGPRLKGKRQGLRDAAVHARQERLAAVIPPPRKRHHGLGLLGSASNAAAAASAGVAGVQRRRSVARVHPGGATTTATPARHGVPAGHMLHRLHLRHTQRSNVVREREDLGDGADALMPLGWLLRARAAVAAAAASRAHARGRRGVRVGAEGRPGPVPSLLSALRDRRQRRRSRRHSRSIAVVAVPLLMLLLLLLPPPSFQRRRIPCRPVVLLRRARARALAGRISTAFVCRRRPRSFWARRPPARVIAAVTAAAAGGGGVTGLNRHRKGQDRGPTGGPGLTARLLPADVHVLPGRLDLRVDQVPELPDDLELIEVPLGGSGGAPAGGVPAAPGGTVGVEVVLPRRSVHGDAELGALVARHVVHVEAGPVAEASLDDGVEERRPLVLWCTAGRQAGRQEQ